MKKLILLTAALVLFVGAAFATSVSFNSGWEFSQDQKVWQAVDLPHDWAIGSDFDPVAHESGSGALPWKGVGWYRKSVSFTLAELEGKRLFLDFGGVQGTATVFVNGQSVAKWRYGYLGFTAPLVPYVTTGRNEILVKADTNDWGSRWYPGAGIYRNVALRVTDDVRLEKTELFATTPAVSSERAMLAVRGAAYSHRVAAAKGTVTAKLLDPKGAVVAEKSCEVAVPGCEFGRFEMSFDVPQPQLWEMRDPAPLYTLAVSLAGEGFADRLEAKVGFRDFRFDVGRGFFLNGRRVQLNGVNLHSDLGILGMAFNKSAMRRQLKKLRDMGVNALRTSHNPPAEEVLDLCDEMGIFVWDEAFDKWNATCGRGDEPLEPYVERVLTAFVRRDRNHPSVFVWSIGNEIPSGGGFAPGQATWGIPASLGTNPERCARFRNVVLAEDATRPVGIGSCFPVAVKKGDYASLDITGWNYRALYREMYEKYPDKPVLYTESASAFSDYGFYADRLPTNKTDYAWDVFKIDSYDHNSASWSDIPDLEFERMERDRYCGGEFVWTGIDYLGEPTPFAEEKTTERAEQARSSYFGTFDLLVMPKDRVFLYRSHWNKDAFTLHIVPHHWNFAGRTDLPVYVYSNADEVELFVNNKSQGRRRLDPTASAKAGYYDVLKRYRFVWERVAYAEGEVKAVAYGKDGQKLGEQVLRTAGVPMRVVVTSEAQAVPADGETLVFAAVTLSDAKGTPVPDDHRRIRFVLTGPGEIVAVGNADPRGRDSFKKTDSHTLFFGRAGLAVRRFKDRREPIILTASADGLEPAVVTLSDVWK
jgi:beta-galactosidase